MAVDLPDSSVDGQVQPPDTLKVGRRRAVLWVGATALNLWVVAILMPIVRSSVFDGAEAMSAGVVFLGTVAAGGSMHRGLRWPALLGYPGLVLLHLLAGFGADSGVALIAATGAMGVYIAVAASFATRPRWRNVTVRSLGERPPHKDRVRRMRMRRLVMGVVATASFCIGVVLPALFFDEGSWTENTRPAARATVAVLAGIVATMMLAAFAGPATRRRRAGAISPARRRKRVGMLLTVAFFGAAIAFVISR